MLKGSSRDLVINIKLILNRHLNRLSLPKFFQSVSDQNACNEGLQGVHPVPLRLPSREALSCPMARPAQAPSRQGHLADGAERAACARTSSRPCETTQAGLFRLCLRTPAPAFTPLKPAEGHLSSVGFSLRLLWAAVGRHGADRQQSRDCSATVLEVWSPPAGADPDRARPG